MTKETITERLEEIKKMADDAESEEAHIKEDELYIEFIESIAKGKDLLGEKARMVLSANDIEFERWYA